MSLRKSAVLSALCASLLSTSCGRDAKPERTYPMGERVQVGHLIYTVFETQWMTHLGEGPSQRVPQHRYFLVRLSVTNSGSGTAIAPTITLVEDGGNTHNELSNGEFAPQWMGALRQIKPAETAQGHILFDVPPKHYKLRVVDENEQASALVDIPLSFGAETPDIPGAPQSNP